MDAITTTLAKIRACHPCEDGYRKLVKSLGGSRKYGKDTPITFQQIYASNGYDDTLWCLRATDGKYNYLWRHFAVDAAQSVEHLNTDMRVFECNEVMRRYTDGDATEQERASARAAAWAAWAAWAVGDGARSAVWTVWAARAAGAAGAAWAAAGYAAWAAAGDAARSAVWTAGAARAAQMRLLFDYCREGKRPDNSAEVLKRYIAEANTAKEA